MKEQSRLPLVKQGEMSLIESISLTDAVEFTPESPPVTRRIGRNRYF